MAPATTGVLHAVPEDNRGLKKKLDRSSIFLFRRSGGRVRHTWRLGTRGQKGAPNFCHRRKLKTLFAGN